ncbi:HTH-type transcriptional repressor YcgE [Yersinia frederiksenii]|uniref:HTH-type transcriptional repressor YcgE n=2 Tax=Yersinia frederiksenii TaxID=29484 RepID=A0A380PTJ7_YERFR|nr:MerR family transcriptional regulator [Yersinia frederiksenii]ATM94540.1 helix-turn-helix-type transcriptional regulator [Yersinia frederiksenii]KGA48599.1 merR regulatory family protein [Yersinia frederiksenii ATCC 33641]MDN0120101.1 MerR family transcriptional regulator [Yersinia frederiksenii]CFR07097.1 HTH-type transcriptional repressor YcgE [Yersinia frederiksenii]CNG41701.1 HTH-type transcriptional repressor YcgE [Yersinia frederiksenii]
MALYSISEVAQLCGINPVTLRAWQRRYGLLKPQRTEGGHRQFNDDDIKRIRSILRWIERGVPVSQIKPLLDGGTVPDDSTNWVTLQQQLLALIQAPAPHKLRSRIFELGREYPPQALIEYVLRPLRSQLKNDHQLLQMLCSLLDGVIIEYATFCMLGARKKPGENVLLLGWGNTDPTELWMAAIVLAKNDMHIDVLPGSLEYPQLAMFKAERYFLCTDGVLNTAKRRQLTAWCDAGLNITLIDNHTPLIVASEHHHE